MKKHPEVAAAEALVEEKTKALVAAKEAVQVLERERGDAVLALHAAQKSADSALPQCRLVRVSWRSGKAEDAGLVVILRKTPGGMLVVRKVGDASGASEAKFKWREHSGKYAEAKKSSSFTSDQMELRDVPSDYLGVAKAA